MKKRLQILIVILFIISNLNIALADSGKIGKLFKKQGNFYFFDGVNIRDSSISSSELKSGIIKQEHIKNNFSLWEKFENNFYTTDSIGIGTKDNTASLNIKGDVKIAGNLQVNGKNVLIETECYGFNRGLQLENGKLVCKEIKVPCPIQNGKGVYTEIAKCIPTHCNDGYHKEGILCYSDRKLVTCVQSGKPSNSTYINRNVYITWNYGYWNQAASCEWTCNSGYHKSGNSCLRDSSGGGGGGGLTRTCSLWIGYKTYQECADKIQWHSNRYCQHRKPVADWQNPSGYRHVVVCSWK